MSVDRHGDVIVIGLGFDVDGPVEKDRTVALGEVTGHSHQFTEGAEKILFNPNLKSHVKAKKTVYEELRTHFAKEFPGEKFPFAAEDIEIGCFIRVAKPCKLVHEEHKALSYEDPDTKAVIIQRGYTPEGWKKALD